MGLAVCCSKQAEPCPACPQQQLKNPKDREVRQKRRRRRNNGRDGVRDELEEGRRRGVGDGGGGGVSSRVMLKGRRAAREAGCYGLFSPGVGATWTRCALPSAQAST